MHSFIKYYIKLSHKSTIQSILLHSFSPSSPNILYPLPNPFKKLLQQIYPTNHKLLHKLIRLFQLILQASVLLPEHLILISQLYHLLPQIIIAIYGFQKFLLKPFCLLQFNLCLLRLPLCGVYYHHPLVSLFFELPQFPFVYQRADPDYHNIPAVIQNSLSVNPLFPTAISEFQPWYHPASFELRIVLFEY